MIAKPFRPGCKTCRESIPALGRECADCRGSAAKARGERVIACVRYYPNGQFREEDRVEKDLAVWLSYNTKFRPSNSLFVDGKCRNVGIGFTQTDCDDIESCLATGRRWTPRGERKTAAEKSN